MAYKLARREMIALWIGISVIALMCLLPPWQYDPSGKGHWVSAVYWPVFLQPRELVRSTTLSAPSPSEPLPEQPRCELSITDLAKVSFKPLNLCWTDYGRSHYVKFEVHNQTGRPLSEITIDVFVGQKVKPSAVRLMTPEEFLAEKPSASVRPSPVRRMTFEEALAEKPAAPATPSKVRPMTTEEFLAAEAETPRLRTDAEVGLTATAPKMTEDEVRAWARAQEVGPGTAAPPGPMVYTSEACTFHTPITPGAQLGGDAKLPYDFKFDVNSQQWWALLKAAKWASEDLFAADWAYYGEQMKARGKGAVVHEYNLVRITDPTRIDTTRLGVQCVLVALLTGGVLFTLRNRAGQSREK